MKYVILVLLIIRSIDLLSQGESNIETKLNLSDTLSLEYLSNSGNKEIIINNNGQIVFDTTIYNLGITAAALHPIRTEMGLDYDFVSGLAVYQGTSAFIADIDLPRNASIVGFEMYYVDTSLNGNITCELRKLDVTNNNHVIMESLISSGAPSANNDDVLKIESNQIAGNHIVSDFHQLFVFSDNWDGQGLRLVGVIIKYEM